MLDFTAAKQKAAQKDAQLQKTLRGNSPAISSVKTPLLDAHKAKSGTVLSPAGALKTGTNIKLSTPILDAANTDVEKKAKATKESFFEKIGRYMSGSTDATIPTAAINTNKETPTFVGNVAGGAVKGAAGDALNAISVMGENPLNPLTYGLGQYNKLVAPNAVAKTKEFANKLSESSAQDIAAAKEGRSKADQLGIDVSVAGLQLAGDVGAGIATGGGALVPMALRAFGGGAKQAENAGGSLGKQIVYGTLQAGTAALTEKLSNAGNVLTKAFGKGALDDALQSATTKAINRVITSDAGKAAAQRIATAGSAAIGEGFEEMVQDALTPIYQQLTYDKNAKLDAEGMLYDGLVGAILGGALGGVGGGNVDTDTSKTAVDTKNNIAPNLVQNVSKPLEAVQAHVSDVTIKPTTDTAKLGTPSVAQQGTPDAQIQPTDSTGAAPKGFSSEADKTFEAYQDAVDKYGAMDERTNLARQMEVPKAVSDDGTVIPQTAQTIMGSDITPSNFVGQMVEDIANGKMSKAVYSDTEAVTKAESTITDKGFQQALADWTADVKNGKVSKDSTALGITLYNNAVNSGDYKTASAIVADMMDNYRSVGQALQAVNLFNKMTPEYKLYTLQRSVQNMNDELTAKFEKRGFKGITIDNALVKNYMEAKTDAERETAMDALKDSVAAQVPSTWYDKWNAWRYLSMLGNVRTHVRNIIGNAGFAPFRGLKNVIATGAERLTGTENRTKSILTLKDRPLVEQAQSDYDKVSDQIMNLGKFDNLTGDINSRRKIFNTPFLEALRKGNSKALDTEDVWFAKPAYSNALAGWYKANGVTAEQLKSGAVPEETITKAREYAIREAQRATYRDSNKFSDFVAGLGKTKSKAANAIVEGILPFKRTPANILARAVEYSPVGLIKGLTSDVIKVHNGSMEAWQAIDNVSAGLTGTGIVALGALLASMGLIQGGKSDDDKESTLDTLTGHQNYSLSIGGKNITLDWLAPEALPFFVGVEIFNAATDKSEDGVTFGDVLNKISNIADPMLEMSMLQGVNDLIDSVKYSDKGNAVSIAATAAVNYLSQGLPTLLGQLERVGEKERETTYVDKTSGVPTAVQYMLGKLGNKIPGVEYQQRPYTDAFGNRQSSGNVAERVFNNMLNPSYVTDTKDGAVTDELRRLNDGNYLNSAPDLPERGFSYNGKDYNMNAKEYTAFSESAGKFTYDLMQTMIDEKAYAKMTDEQKAAAISNVMGYAEDKAKKQFLSDKGVAYESDAYKKVYEAEQAGISPSDYYAFKSKLSEIDTNGSPTQIEKTQAIEATDLTTQYKGKLWEIQNPDSNPDKNPYTGTLAQKNLPPEKNIEIMEGYSTIEKAMDNYVKPEDGASVSHVQAAYFKQWLEKQGYSSEQVQAITDVFKVWQMIPVEKVSKKATAFVNANPMP